MVILYLLGFCALPSAARAQVPVYEVTPVESTIKFDVESSVPLKGTFDICNSEFFCFRHATNGEVAFHIE